MQLSVKSIMPLMALERPPKPPSKVRTGLLWLAVGIAYPGWVAVILLVMLQMASGYSSSFLGTGTPPNTVEFRHIVGQYALLAYMFSAGGAVAALWHGDRAMRWAAAIPATLSALALLFTLVSRLS